MSNYSARDKYSQVSKEDGYFSNGSRSTSSFDRFPSCPLQQSYHVNHISHGNNNSYSNHVNTNYDNNISSHDNNKFLPTPVKEIKSDNNLFSPTRLPSYLINSSNNNHKNNCRCTTPEIDVNLNYSSPTSVPPYSTIPFQTFDANLGTGNTDGRGLLIDRIKIAQNTIDTLSSKVFCYENEREQLRQQKENYENGYYKLLKENSEIMTDKLEKDRLLNKVNVLGDEVAELLKVQEDLLQKHREQEKDLDFYKSQNKLLEAENETSNNLKNSLTEASMKSTMLVETLRKSEEDLKGQIVVMKIEKEALTSEFDRLAQKLQRHDDKLKHQKEKETAWIRQLTISHEKINGYEKDLVGAEQTIEFLQKQMKNAAIEREETESTFKEQLKIAQEQTSVLQSSVCTLNETVRDAERKHSELQKNEEILAKGNCNLKKQLGNLKDENHKLSADKQEYEMLKTKLEEHLKFSERENKECKQRLKEYQSKINTLESSIKSEQEKHKEVQKISEEKIKALTVEIDKLQSDAQIDRLELEKKHHLHLLEIESTNNKSEETIKNLQSEIYYANQKCENLNSEYIAYKEEQMEARLFRDQEISALRTSEARIMKKLSELDGLCTQYTHDLLEMSQKLTKVESENVILLENCDEKTKLIEKHQIKNQKLVDDITMLRNKNNENLQKIDDLKKQAKTNISNQKSLYESQLRSLRADLESVTTELKNTKQELRVSTETYKGTMSNIQKNTDTKLETISNERDELTEELHNATLDLNEYKSKFSSLQAELEDVCSVNADLKENLSLLSKELEFHQQDSFINTQNEAKIWHLEETIEQLKVKIERLETQNKDFEQHNSKLLKDAIKTRENINELTTTNQQMKIQFEKEEIELASRESAWTKDRKEYQIRIEKLKAECRKRTMQSHAKIGELEVAKGEIVGMKNEMDVLKELNEKLEEVNGKLQGESKQLQSSIGQLQEDMKILKASYEDLLAKELDKQRSEFLVKENKLLKQLSNDHSHRISPYMQSSPVS